MMRAAPATPPGRPPASPTGLTPKQEKDERRYNALVQHLRELANEKAGSTSAAKKVLAAMEELVGIAYLAEPMLAPLAMGAAKFAGKAEGLHSYINILVWAALTQGTPSTAHFNAVTKVATEGITHDSYEHKRTCLLVLLMLSLIQQNSASLYLQLHPSFVQDITGLLEKSLDAKTGEKRGFSTKATWHEGKKMRLLAHLSALRVFGLTFVTHTYPHLQVQGKAHKTRPLASLLVQTAIEYSYKAKEIPVVRESLQGLIAIAQVAPNDVQCVTEYLPLDMEKVSCVQPLRKDKDAKKKKDKPYLTCWDPIAAGLIVKLCLAVLSQVSERAALQSPFMVCVYQLFHHPRYLVFADALFGVVKRSGLFYVLLQPDQVYRSKELLLVYATNRIQSMVSGPCQVTCNAGLRLTIAVTEQILTHYESRTAEVLSALHALGELEVSVSAALERYAADPLIATNALKSLVWLTAVEVLQREEQRSVSKPMRVRQLLHALVHTTCNSPLQSDHTYDVLKAMNRAMRVLPPAGGARALMIPAFTGIVEYLIQRCAHKMSIQNLYGVLQEFLINVDIVSVDDAAAGDAVVAPLDIDAVPQQRNDGGTHTLRLVAGMLDGVVSPEVAAAEQLLSLHASAAEGKQQRRSRMIIELVRFTGDFGNVMVNGKEWGDCASNMMLLLVRLQTLLHTQPHHIVWEAALAVLKVSSRSLTAVRVKAFTVLTDVVAVRPGLATLLAPLIKILDDCLQLQERYNSTLMAIDDKDSMVDVGLAAESFYSQHENLKERLSVYSRFVELKRLRLLGEASESLLKRGQERSAAARAPAAAAQGGGVDIMFSPG